MDICRYCFCIRATMHVLWSSLSYSEFCKLMTNWGFLCGFLWPPALLDSIFQDPCNSSTCHVKPIVKSSDLSCEMLQIPYLSGARLQISKFSKFCGRKTIQDLTKILLLSRKKIKTAFHTFIKSSMDRRNSPSFSESILQTLLLSAVDKEFSSSELSDQAPFHSCLQNFKRYFIL